MRPWGRRCAGVALALVADRVLSEPPDRFHPVAWFGRLMNCLERTCWADRRSHGAGYAAAGATAGAVAGKAIGSTVAGASLAIAGRGLTDAAHAVAASLSAGDIEGARRMLPSLVGRDPRDLDESEIAAAAIESVAENSVDAIVAPAVWAAVGGAPAALAYRAVNTMDAMVGHRSARYEQFGWASARLDDLANFVPARLLWGLLMLTERDRRGEVHRLVRRDAARHPSPNAGVAETAMAAVLGVELGGPLRYGARVEQRPRLGEGPRPAASDIDRSIAVVQRAQWLLAGCLAGAALFDALWAGRSDPRQATPAAR